MDLLFLLLLSSIIFGGLGAWIAVQKNRPSGEGILLGALFGPLGAIIETLLPAGQTRLISKRASDSAMEPIPDFTGLGSSTKSSREKVDVIERIRRGAGPS